MIHFGTGSLSLKHLIISCLVILVSRPVLSQTDTAEALARQAVALEAKNDNEGIVRILEGQKDKVGRSGLVLLSRAYFKLGRFTDEVSTLELANARFPKDAQLVTFLAAAIAHTGRKDAAIETYYKAREVNSRFIPAYEGLLHELVKAESRQEARDLLSDMTKKFGSRAVWMSQQCALFTADAFYEKSVEYCIKALKREPGNPMNAVHLATTYREQGKADLAKKVLVSAANRIKKSEPVQTALGDYFVEKKNFVDAFRWYGAGTKTDPTSYRAQLGLALSAMELQKMEDGLRAFSAACKIDRKAIREFQGALGKIRQRSDYLWQNKFEEAIAEACQPR